MSVCSDLIELWLWESFDTNCNDRAIRIWNEMCVTAAALTVDCVVKWAKSGGQITIINLPLSTAPFLSPRAVSLPALPLKFSCGPHTSQFQKPWTLSYADTSQHAKHTHYTPPSTYTCKHTETHTHKHTLRPTFIEQESNYLTQL